MKKRSLLQIFITIFILGILIYLWYPAKSKKVLFSDESLASAVHPIQNVFHKISNWFSDTWSNYVNLIGVQEENQRLKKELANQQTKTYLLQERLERLETYEWILNHYSFPDRKILPVEIVSHDIFVPSKSIVINKGKNDGLSLQDVVITGDGLVGKVLRVYAKTSDVILITDPHFRVDAMSTHTKNRIIIKGVDSDLLIGKGYPLLTQTEFLLHEQSFQIDEKLVTSGFGGVYPQGLPIGKVTEIKSKSSGLFSEADILPAVDFAKRNPLFVLIKSQAGESE